MTETTVPEPPPPKARRDTDHGDHRERDADSYPVLVGRGTRSPSVADHLGADVRKVLIVHTSTLGAQAVALRESLLDRYEVLLAEVPDAEAAKRVEVAAFCWQVMGQADFSRTDAVIGFGGGAVTDLAGFVASTWLRGVRARADPHQRARHGRCGHRRQERHQHGRGQEPRRHVLRARRGDLRPRRCSTTCRGTRSSPASPRSSRPDSSRSRRSSTSSRRMSRPSPTRGPRSSAASSSSPST